MSIQLRLAAVFDTLIFYAYRGVLGVTQLLLPLLISLAPALHFCCPCELHEELLTFQAYSCYRTSPQHHVQVHGGITQPHQSPLQLCLLHTAPLPRRGAGEGFLAGWQLCHLESGTENISSLQFSFIRRLKAWFGKPGILLVLSIQAVPDCSAALGPAGLILCTTIRPAPISRCDLQ